MNMGMLKKLLTVFVVCGLYVSNIWATPTFLPPEKAFQVEATWLENSTQLELEFLPAKGYYIYQESLHFQMGREAGALLAVKPALPSGQEKFDETFQKTMQIYRAPFIVEWGVSVDQGKPIHLAIELQGCAEGGICYPPMTLRFLLAAPGVKAAPLPDEGAAAPANLASKQEGISLLDLWRERDNINAINRFLASTSTTYLLLAFFILGLALAFTPCVLPMLPILSSVVFGKQDNKTVSKKRAIVLASSYILGMTLVYTLAGILMAALGGSVQRVLQSPIALATFSLLLLFLSGSLFGLYELRMPSAWQDRIDRLAGRHKGGNIAGAFALGGISTLVASPCITAPLAGVLGFIAQTGSMTLGGGLLFVMALGMGLPLLLIAVEARMLIPSTGIWMVWLQRTLGVLLVATAAWIASPLLNQNESRVNLDSASGQVQHQIGSLNFAVIQTNQELEQFLSKAKEEKKIVLLDFYADWCISCKEMEVNTFANPAVAKELERFVLLQADVTKNSADNQALLKRFNLFGPPGILFFNTQSEEKTDLRVIGYVPPERFLGQLKKALQ
jgi:thioredoxin:protein disulfide reductase